MTNPFNTFYLFKSETPFAVKALLNKVILTLLIITGYGIGVKPTSNGLRTIEGAHEQNMAQHKSGLWSKLQSPY